MPCLKRDFPRIRLDHGGRLPPLQEDAMLMPQKVISHIYASSMAALKAAATRKRDALPQTGFYSAYASPMAALKAAATVV